MLRRAHAGGRRTRRPEIVEFSPSVELQQTTAAIGRNLEAVKAAASSGASHDDDDVARAAARLVTFLEEGEPPPGLFSDDVFCDFTMPHWRLQPAGIEAVTALRREGYPAPGTVGRRRCDTTPTGFLLEFEEHWEEGSQRRYGGEMARTDLTDGPSRSCRSTGPGPGTRTCRRATGARWRCSDRNDRIIRGRRSAPARAPRVRPWSLCGLRKRAGCSGSCETSCRGRRAGKVLGPDNPSDLQT